MAQATGHLSGVLSCLPENSADSVRTIFGRFNACPGNLWLMGNRQYQYSFSPVFWLHIVTQFYTPMLRINAIPTPFARKRARFEITITFIEHHLKITLQLNDQDCSRLIQLIH